MGLIPDARPHHLGRPRDAAPKRRAFLFQRPVMLRRSAAGNIRYALRRPGRGGNVPPVAELIAMVGLEGSKAVPRAGCRAASSSAGARPGAGARSRGAVSRRADRQPRSRRHQGDRRIVHDIAASGIKMVMSTHDLGQARRSPARSFAASRAANRDRPAADLLTPRHEEAECSSPENCWSEKKQEEHRHVHRAAFIAAAASVSRPGRRRAGQVDRRRLNHLNLGFRPVRLSAADLQAKTGITSKWWRRALGNHLATREINRLILSIDNVCTCVHP